MCGLTSQGQLSVDKSLLCKLQFLLFSLFLFETTVHYAALAGFELTENSLPLTPSAKVKGLHHHPST